ncbi:MAG: alcohol dehydrogenase catalytic domain-containing protein [Christensenella sp.]|uniref:zinc-dependent alcohol dehydrogenase n=1 Tax=Christensenella sp. TaxID=1935934 RepID=UPI002B1F090A|nr:alcohol dehydrogenase catalytic domain-containing protein [Christensenella sp.]MEA5002340.1 alcohol dehydrogenase catalytic domain-containing protein [Christensenella sp.]
MKALVKFAEGRQGMEIRDIPIPTPKKNELLVKIMAAGICGTDIHLMHDEYTYYPPVILGHEYTGIVEGMGSAVSGFAKGDQIISMTAAVTCGHCGYCREGLLMLCNERRSIGSGVNGAMAEYMVIPAELAFKLPANVSGDDTMAIAEPLACVIRAVIEQSHIKAGDVALVSGPGTIGQLTMLIAKMQGAYVIMSGTPQDAERLALARELGADAVCSSPQELKSIIDKITVDGVDVAYECAGAPPSLDVCINMLKKTGNLAQVGLYGKPVPVDMDKILCKELALSVSYATERTSWDILLKLASQGKLEKVKKLISARMPLDEWETAFDMFANKEGYKIYLIP